MAAQRRPGRRGDRPKEARPLHERFGRDHCLQPGHALSLRIPAADLAIAGVVVWTQRRISAGGTSGDRRQDLPPASRLILPLRFRIPTYAAKVDVDACGTVVMVTARQCVPCLTTDPQCGIGGSERPEAARANGELSDGAAHESGFAFGVASDQSRECDSERCSANVNSPASSFANSLQL
jgi:hypothetical protein